MLFISPGIRIPDCDAVSPSAELVHLSESKEERNELKKDKEEKDVKNGKNGRDGKDESDSQLLAQLSSMRFATQAIYDLD